MKGNISVIYEKGVLRPLRPLDLPEHTRLEIQIVNSVETTTEDAERAAQVLVAAGLTMTAVLLMGLVGSTAIIPTVFCCWR